MSACYVDLQGSLGDQLFQAATGYAHCKRHGYDLRLRTHPENSYWHSYLHKLAGSRGGQNLGLAWKERSPAYREIPFNALNLFGRFQSSKYFAEYATEIRSLFTVPEEIGVATIAVYRDDSCSPDYYERAIRQMKAVAPTAPVVIISTMDESEALCLMRQCRYLVLSKSSLSWWGAWLAEKPLYVIAPTGLPEDYYEARWDRMSQ